MKRIGTIGIGAVMLGATAMGAYASLADYPEPFVTDGVFNGKIVVGGEAAVSDVIGAVDIAASLQYAAKTGYESTDGVTTVEGGQVEDLLFGQALSVQFGTSGILDDGDLAGFADDQFDYNDTDVDYGEYLNISGVTVQYNLGYASEAEDMGADPYLQVNEAGYEYYVAVDAADQASIVGVGVSDDEDYNIEFDFLGESFEIIDITATGIKYKNSVTEILTRDNPVTVAGHEIELVNVGDTSAVIKVDGVSDVISTGNTETYGDIEIKVESLFNADDNADDFVEALIGEDTGGKTANDGDDFELFTEYDSGDAPWVWNIDTNAGASLDRVGVQLTNAMSEVVGATEEELDADYFEMVGVGGVLPFPNDYVSVTFDSLKYDDRFKVVVDAKEVKDEDNTGHPGFEITLSGTDEQAFNLGGTQSKKIRAYLADPTNMSNGLNVTYYDEDDGWTDLASTLAQDNLATWYIENNDAKYYFNVVTIGNGATEGNFTFVDDGGLDNIRINARYALRGATYTIGATDENLGTDLYYDTTAIGARDYDLLTEYGAIIYNPENKLDSDKVEFSIPSDQVEAHIIITTSGSTVTTTAGDASSYVVNQIPVGLGVLDSVGASLVGNTNLLVVGGPCANTVARDLLGVTAANCVEGFEQGVGRIKLFGTQNAVLVAGYTAEDTLLAAQTLANYDMYAGQLVGSEVMVSLQDGSDTPVIAPYVAPAAEEEDDTTGDEA